MNKPKLEVIVLKVDSHSTEQDAKDLDVYLPDLDVVSLEMDFCEESTARSYEEYYRKRRMGIEDASTYALERTMKDPDRMFSGFVSTLSDMIVAQKKPVIILERLPDAEAQKANRAANRQVGIDVSRLFEGDLDYLCRRIFEQYNETDKHRRLKRDRHMGDNSKLILDRILKVYPELTNQPKIKYGVIVGASHRPEQYISGAKAINVPSGTSVREYNGMEMLGVLTRSGKSGYELNDTLSAMAVMIAYRVVSGIQDIRLLDKTERSMLPHVKYDDAKRLFARFAALPKSTDGFITDAQQSLITGYVNDLH